MATFYWCRDTSVMEGGAAKRDGLWYTKELVRRLGEPPASNEQLGRDSGREAAVACTECGRGLPSEAGSRSPWALPAFRPSRSTRPSLRLLGLRKSSCPT
ncbi:hypothetical protein NN561_015140 [Cricetulus griseus]